MAAPLLPRLGRMAVRTATLPRATAPRNAVSHHEHVVGTLPSREVLSMVVFFVITRVILTEAVTAAAAAGQDRRSWPKPPL